MEENYYPWDGEFTTCDSKSCVAVVKLNVDYTPPQSVAIYGSLKTENIGIEKIVANVISNPNIRYLLICGKDIRGHRSGSSLRALNQEGIDSNNRIIGAPGAIPYIENIKREAVDRFRSQIEVVDLIGEVDKKVIDDTIIKYLKKDPSSFGKPYIAIKITQKSSLELEDNRALHSKITMNYLGKIEKRRG